MVWSWSPSIYNCVSNYNEYEITSRTQNTIIGSFCWSLIENTKNTPDKYSSYQRNLSSALNLKLVTLILRYRANNFIRVSACYEQRLCLYACHSTHHIAWQWRWWWWCHRLIVSSVIYGCCFLLRFSTHSHYHQCGITCWMLSFAVFSDGDRKKNSDNSQSICFHLQPKHVSIYLLLVVVFFCYASGILILHF